MIQVGFIETLTKYVPKIIRYSKVPKGMEIFHSVNPFVGDKLVYGGQKLANGPKTLMRELKSFGYKSNESRFLLGKCESAPELYPQMSAMLKDISPEILSSTSLREQIMRNMNELADYSLRYPESIPDIKNWGKIFNTLCAEEIVLKLEDCLKYNITDFKYLEKMLKSVVRVGRKEAYEIPQIMKESKLPKEELCKIFDDVLSLAENDTRYVLSRGKFRQQLLPVLNQNPDKAAQFSDLLKELVTGKVKAGKLDAHELEEICKFLKEEWQIDFIKNFQGRLYEPLKHIKSAEQGKIAVKLSNDRNSHALKELYKAADNGVLNSKGQIEAYNYLLDFKLNNGIASDSIKRFSGAAREDICRNIKSEADLEILKLMAEKKNVRGEDLYTTHAIIKVLEQPLEKKTKIIEKLRKTVTWNSHANGTVRGKRIAYLRKSQQLHASSTVKAGGRIVENEKQFQQVVRQLPSGLKDAELLKRMAPGEVVEVGSKLLASDGEKLVQLKMDKATFMDLFVSDEHLMQGFLGDCGAVATLDGILSTPKGKCAIYQLFEQAGDDIYINLKDYGKKIKFENGEVVKYGGLFRGSKGIKMLEQAFAISSPKTKQTQSATITAYKDLVEENGGYFSNIMVSLCGIDPNDVLLKIFGNNYKSEIKNIGDLSLQGMKALNPKDNRFALLATRSSFGAMRTDEIEKWHMNVRHWQNIKGLDRSGKLNVTNPHDASFAAKVPAYEVLISDFIDNIRYVDLG